MASNRSVQYVDFGITSAKQFWTESVVPSCERFESQPSRANAIDASFHAWHVHEWIWHEHHPGQDIRQNNAYKDFLADLIKGCAELSWIRDVADAGKHRGLSSRSPEVRRMSGERLLGPYATVPYNTLPYNEIVLESVPLSITLTDGSTHGFAGVLSSVMNYWRSKHFAPAANLRPRPASSVARPA